jgi:hypothetical protein
MKEKTSEDNLARQNNIKSDPDDLEGYPSYPPTEDIYGNYQKERDRNPEDPNNIKEILAIIHAGKNNEMDFDDDFSGDDLDIPGSELDDQRELIGSEDEENNYYSLGGDEHNDLEEDYVE